MQNLGKTKLNIFPPPSTIHGTIPPFPTQPSSSHPIQLQRCPATSSLYFPSPLFLSTSSPCPLLFLSSTNDPYSYNPKAPSCLQPPHPPLAALSLKESALHSPMALQNFVYQRNCNSSLNSKPEPYPKRPLPALTPSSWWKTAPRNLMMLQHILPKRTPKPKHSLNLTNRPWIN